MGFGNNARRTYFKIKDGAVIVTIKAENEDTHQDLIAVADSLKRYVGDKNGVEYIDIHFGFFEGYIQKFELVDVTFNNTAVKQWNITIADENSNIYVWTTYYNGYHIQTLLNCLASIDGEIGLIRIQPWVGKDDKTRITLYHNGHTKDDKLGWKYELDEIPAIEKVMIMDTKTKKPIPFINKKTGKQELDDNARMEFFSTLAEELNDKLMGEHPSGAVAKNTTAKTNTPTKGKAIDLSEHLSEEPEMVEEDRF